MTITLLRRQRRTRTQQGERYSTEICECSGVVVRTLYLGPVLIAAGISITGSRARTHSGYPCKSLVC